jgi:hypothetical protein
MAVSSRSFCLVDSAGSKYACMVPFADFANHDPYTANATFQLSPTKCSCKTGLPACCPALQLATKHAMDSTEEVLINYGADKSNQALLESYGFAVEANLSDRLPLGQQRQWKDFADTDSELRVLDKVALSVLRAAGIQLGTASSGSIHKATNTHFCRPASHADAHTCWMHVLACTRTPLCKGPRSLTWSTLRRGSDGSHTRQRGC